MCEYLSITRCNRSEDVRTPTEDFSDVTLACEDTDDHAGRDKVIW